MREEDRTCPVLSSGSGGGPQGPQGLSGISRVNLWIVVSLGCHLGVTWGREDAVGIHPHPQQTAM